MITFWRNKRGSTCNSFLCSPCTLHWSRKTYPELSINMAEQPVCIVATKVAETSLIIFGVAYKIDCGFVMLRIHDCKTGIDVLIRVPLSKKLGETTRWSRRPNERRTSLSALFTFTLRCIQWKHDVWNLEISFDGSYSWRWRYVEVSTNFQDAKRQSSCCFGATLRATGNR